MFAAGEDFLDVIYFSRVLYKYSQAHEVHRKLVCQEVLAIVHSSQLLSHIWKCIHVDLILFSTRVCGCIYTLWNMRIPFLKDSI